MKRELMLVIALAALVSCDGKPKKELLPPPPQIIQDQKQALDNAKEGGDMLEKQAEEQWKKIEEASK